MLGYNHQISRQYFSSINFYYKVALCQAARAQILRWWLKADDSKNDSVIDEWKTELLGKAGS